MYWWEIVLRLLLAGAVGCIIGGEREHHHRPAGLRTHILVCLGASMVAMMECLNMDLVTTAASASVNLGRMSAQVISGIGFLGAGTIFMAQRKIAGLTTAASLWCTACMGLAAGMGHYILLAAGCLTVVLTLALLPHVVPHDSLHRIQIILHDRTVTLPWLEDYFHQKNIRVVAMDLCDAGGSCTVQYTLHLPRRMTLPQALSPLTHQTDITTVRAMTE